MKRFATFFFLFALVTGVFQPGSAWAGTAAPGDKSPGASMATAISTVTGVAMSPVLGPAAVGCYKYMGAKTEKDKAALPWFARPYFFIPAGLVVCLCALKDVFGIAIPGPLKKPFDAMETVEHKVSGLVAAGAFVPFIASVFHGASGGGSSALLGSGHGFLASADISWLYNLLILPVAWVAYFIVFLASNAINILILLSPFSTVDAALKSFRLFILSTVTVSAFANPMVGAAWAIIIICIAWFVSGWSFRLSHLGMMFVWEQFTFAKTRFEPRKDGNYMFLGRPMEKVPTRTYGKLERDDKGGLIFHYRPWLFLPQRTLVLPKGQYYVGHGMFYSEIEIEENGENRMLFILPPRYRGHEEALSTAQGLLGVRPAGLLAAFAWLRDRLGLGASAA